MDEKVALISGTSREQGLGFAVARQLVDESFTVVLTARKVAKAEELAGRLRSEGASALALGLDVTDPASVAACAEEVGTRFDRLDVLVNNASTVPDFDAGSVLEADPDEALGAYEVNVVGSWRLTLALMPLLRSAPAARIVNVSSKDALRIAGASAAHEDIASPGFSMAKYGLNALTAALAAGLGDTSILVNAVDPGETASHPEIGDESDARPPAESARGVVWAATLGADGPSGGFFRDGAPLS